MAAAAQRAAVLRLVVALLALHLQLLLRVVARAVAPQQR